MKKFFAFIFALSIYGSALAQNTQRIHKELVWQKTTIPSLVEGKAPLETYTFSEAIFSHRTKGLPWFSMSLPVEAYGNLRVVILNPQYEAIELGEGVDKSSINETIDIKSRVNVARNSYNGKLSFVPIIKSNGRLLRLTAFDLEVTIVPKSLLVEQRGGPTNKSVLADGAIYKIAIEATGIHKIDAKFLKDLGIDLSKVDARKIKVYGNAGGIVPESNIEPRYDDLVENPIVINGEADGKFDDNDFLLFYAVGADAWYFDSTAQQYVMTRNPYTFTSNYFIKIDGENGKRIAEKASLANAEYTSVGFDDYTHYEKDAINLLNAFPYTTGSGRQWYGEKLTPTKGTLTVGELNIPNVITTEPAKIRANLAVRSGQRGDLKLKVQNFETQREYSNVVLAEPEYSYAVDAAMSASFFPKGDDFTTQFTITDFDYEAWLDYVAINARRQPIMKGSQLRFRDLKATKYPTAAYTLKEAAGVEVWNITEPTAAYRQAANILNNNLTFNANSGKQIQEYIAFNAAANNLLKPKAIGKINNQNLHGIEKADLVIIYPKALKNSSERLAKHRSTFNKLHVKTVLLDEVYNEFSSGAMDISAIRDFAKMIYERDPNFKYLLLMGDGSFNFRDIGIEPEKNNNLMPAYETIESLQHIESFPTDDFFGLLSPDDKGDLNGDLELSVGRIPAVNEEQSNAIVDKIIHYDSNPDAMRDYRNRVVFVTDDHEGDAQTSWETEFLSHIEDNLWTRLTSTPFPNFNGEKIHLSAFPQVTTPGGQRSPDCATAINNAMSKGSLIVNYTGHGGPRGWTQERILNAKEDVPTWANFDKMPLMITATCEFGGYDNPNNFTAGEQVLASDKGGAVGLYSTVRSVYNSSNNALTYAVFSQIYAKKGYDGLAMGEILRRAKNSSNQGSGNRKFAMLGDPSQRLMIPQYNVSTISINGKNTKANLIDTIGALSRLEVEGAITDSLGNILTDFNGTVYPTIFDKEIKLKTVPINGIVQDYVAQNRILFKGAATVKNGKFKFSCAIPKDIDYTLGFAKISYYATNGRIDAAGHDKSHLVIGGVNNGAIKDDKAPIVEVFIDNEEFVSGGYTSTNPTLLVRLKDDVGFNVAGNSVGHDMKAILDDNPQNSFRLNDFFEAVNDDSRQGKIKYQLNKLSEGRHKISVKVWDVANNPGDGLAEFVIANTGKTALEHVLNYPNPFTTNTSFQFRHHLAEVNVKVLVRIFSVSGRLVKTIEADGVTDEGRVSNVTWDGKDEFGDELAKGVYVYKVTIQSPRNANIKEESEFEKLVILR